MSILHETECKVPLERSELLFLQNKLEHISLRRWHIYRNDWYYIFSEGQTVRVRRIETGTAEITYKEKRIVENIERNREHTSKVEDAFVLHKIFELLRPDKIVHKIKEGTAYQLEHQHNNVVYPLLAELVEVKSLGFFLELEHTIDASESNKSLLGGGSEDLEKKETYHIQAVLQEVLAALDVPLERIVTEYYIDMLEDSKER